MAIKISINPKNLIPSKTILIEGIFIGITASVVLFLSNFFGLQKVLEFIPEGFEVFTLVFVAVYLKHLFVVKFRGREVI